MCIRDSRAVVLVPLLLPPLVSGVGLLSILGRRGVAGRWLDDWFGVTLPFRTAGVIVAVAFVALPFVDVYKRQRQDQQREERAREDDDRVGDAAIFFLHLSLIHI